MELRFDRIGEANSFAEPTAIVQPPGETRRLYVLEKSGQLRFIKDGIVQPAPLLSLTGIVISGESGLLGLAFHPEFQTNGFFYLLYTTNVAPIGTRIVRYTMDPADPESVDPSTAYWIMTITGRHPQTNHHAGWLGFGPDGYLYISSGDGGWTYVQAQETDSLLGKILRIDVDGNDFPTDPQTNYAIPPTNPLVGVVGAREEIWASGLRNPWRCSFDRQTGDLWIGDVGEVQREEVNFRPAATTPPFTLYNYGWACWEGTVYRPEYCTNPAPPFTDPLYEYGRTLGYSVIGGYVYRGAAIPALRGTYVAGDLSGRMFRFRRDGAGGVSELSHFTFPGISNIFALGEDGEGELYIVTEHLGIFRLLPACWANCDGSTIEPILNVDDFTCFINWFAAGDAYANCDGSTVEPVLNVDDFMCFINRYSAGCP